MRMKFLRFYRLLASQWKKAGLVFFLTNSASALSLAYPFVAKLLIDQAYARKDTGLFFMLMAVLGAIFVLASAINALAGYVSRYLEVKVNFELKRLVFGKLQKIPYLELQKYSTGKQLYTSVYDIDYVAYLVSHIIPQLVFSLPRYLFIFAIVFYLNRPIAAIFLLLLPLVYVACVISARLLKRDVKAWVSSSEQNFEYAQEMLSHYQLIRAFGTERHSLRHYVGIMAANFRFNMANARTNAAVSLIDIVVQRLAVGALVIYGGLQVMQGRMSLGDLSAIALYLGQLAGFQGLLTNSFYHLALGVVSGERLTELLDVPVPVQEKGPKIHPFVNGDIEFNSVSFGYDPSRRILDSIDMRIPAGSRSAFVGPSGCGKTTAVNLLTRVIFPYQGAISIGGARIESFEPQEFFSRIGVALQEPLLWNDTVFNNIRYGKKEAGIEEVRQAAHAACVDDCIDGLARGYETVIGENACRLSEGQKQRIAIARALVKKPAILIIDEGLSSVDAATEEEVMRRIRDLLPASTIIVISHRLSTIALMDLVHFIQPSGRIETGTHAQLLKENVSYQAYLALQTKR